MACLLEAGAHVNAGDAHEEDDDALTAAAGQGYLAVARCLLDAGADVHAKNARALRWAALSRCADSVRLLLDHGAPLSALRPMLHTFRPDVQVAALSAGDIGAFSAPDLARQGVCPDALHVLLERHGRGDLAAMLTATQLMEAMTPEDRAVLLAEFMEPPQADRFYERH